MDVVIACLYESLDSNIYIKVPDIISIPNVHANCNIYCVNVAQVFVWLEAIGTNVVQSIERVHPKQMIL
jgi:hypothetical protein